MARLKVGSLFTGVGGFDLGFERAGFEIAWQVEVDAAARKVLRHRWPTVPIHEDVREVGAHNLAPVDVLVGGFPCQDLSVAGLRTGLAGARSGLFYELMRIARELRPRWVVLENVPGLLTSHGGRDFHAVLAEMADSRFHDRAYRILDSRHFGVPQRRRRVFIVGSAGTVFGRAGSVLLESESGGGNPATRRASRESASGRAASGSGSANVAATLKQRGRGYTDEVIDNLQVASTISASLGHRGHSSPRGDGSDNLVPAVFGTLNSGGNAGEFRTEPGEHLVALNTDVMATLHAGGPGREFNPADQIVGTVCAKWANGSGGPSGDEHHNLVAPTLTASDYEKGWCDQAVKQYGPVMESMAANHGVRRLTPLECERLQGFPDGWTCLCDAHGESARCVCPDSPRYRQMGNAVTVPVIEWIARRLAGVEAGTIAPLMHEERNRWRV